MIAMGFTGSEAVKFKEIYINKFNEMEEALKVNKIRLYFLDKLTSFLL